MIPREVVEEIRSRCDIEEVIGTYVTLKRAGSNRNGLCPFHSEKSPSFTVFPATRSFYCFGCGAGGDVVTFIQKIENLDYVSALEFLAARVGITIPQDSRGGEREALSRRRVYEMNLDAAKFFRACLFDPNVGGEGMAYLAEKRRLPLSVIRHFGLGFAPNDFGALTRYMKEKGYSEEELTAGFLCGRSQKTGRLFDLFRNRVMFPVIDTTGNIVAFGGRVMDDSKPKYLNSADTPGFKKSRVLFGLNFAKNSCAERLILCEGYMDTIAIQAAGFENAVATLGTAITPEHARMLARYTKQVVINYDSDEAGQKAANKAMRLLDEVGLDVRVLKLTGAKDADEYIHKFGADAFRKMLGDSRLPFDFQLEAILSRNDPGTTDGKIRCAREIVSVIAATASGVERELYLKKAGERLGISPDSLAGDVARLRAKQRREYRQKESREVRLEARSFGDKVNPDAAKNPAAAAAENTILGLLLLYPEYRTKVTSGAVPLTGEDFFTDFGRRAFLAVMELERSETGFDFSLLGEKLTPDEMGRLVRLQEDRRALSDNSEAVLSAAVQSLKDATGREKEKGDFAAMLARRRAEAKKNTENG